MPEDVHPGYSIEELEPHRYSLRRQDSTLVPIIIHDNPPRTTSTCEYSHVADQPLDAIIASYTNPTGTPLYTDYVLPTVGIR